MDQSMYILDVVVALTLGGLIIAYNIHARNEMRSMHLEDVFDARRYFLTANILAVCYAVLAIAGLSISVFWYPPAYWITMIILGAFAVVDFIRFLLRWLKLRKDPSAAAAAAAHILRKAGIWMLVYTLLQAANLFYFV